MDLKLNEPPPDGGVKNEVLDVKSVSAALKRRIRGVLLRFVEEAVICEELIAMIAYSFPFTSEANRIEAQQAGSELCNNNGRVEDFREEVQAAFSEFAGSVSAEAVRDITTALMEQKLGSALAEVEREGPGTQCAAPVTGGDQKERALFEDPNTVYDDMLRLVSNDWPDKAVGIVDVLMCKPPAAIHRMLHSEEALQAAVCTAIQEVGDALGVENQGYTTVVRRKDRNRSGAKGGRGGGSGRGTGRGRGRGAGRGRRVKGRRVLEQPAPDVTEVRPGRPNAGTRSASGPKGSPRSSLRAPSLGTGAPRRRHLRPEPGQKNPGNKPAKKAISVWFSDSGGYRDKSWGDETEVDEDAEPVDLGDEDTNPVDLSAKRAVQCTISRKGATMWGYIVRIQSRVATVVHGNNSLLKVRLPTKGKNSTLRAGSPVGVIQLTTQQQDGTVTTRHRLANFPAGVKPEPRLADLPRMRAVVLKVDDDLSDGQVLVPITGAKCPFKTSKLGELTKGSSFSFIPSFEGGLLKVGMVPEDCNLEVVKGGLAKLPTTSSDLLDGFRCPDKRLQAVVKSKFGVDVMPFVGEVLSCFRFSSGNEVLEEFRVHNKYKRLANANLKDLEEVLIKASLYKQDKEWSEDDIRGLVQSPHKHFYVPASGSSETFAKWIKRDLARAAYGGPADRLQAIVGVFVDGDCTLGSLYNTEDVPYFNMEKFPWARSFTLVETPIPCYSMSDQGRLIPAEETSKGKKILLVELDSQSDNSGTLPKPATLTLNTAGSEQRIPLAAEVKRREFVLLSLPEEDPRCRSLIQRCGASVYRRKGKTLILSCPFDTLQEAEKFALENAEKPKDVFSMLRRDLYKHDTLTLSCTGKRPVSAQELFFLTNAIGVLPIGGHRYRISTTMSMLQVAQVLHFQNRYIQKDNMKFVALRNDQNGYVMLNTGSTPQQIKQYYRLEPPRALGRQTGRGYWFRMSNLPNGITKHCLLETLRGLKWWPTSILKSLLDNTKHQPDAWFELKDEAELAGVPLTIRISNRPITIAPTGAPRPALLDETPEVKGDLRQVLNKEMLQWKPAKLTKTYVARRTAGQKRKLRASAGSQSSGSSGRKEASERLTSVREDSKEVAGVVQGVADEKQSSVSLIIPRSPVPRTAMRRQQAGGAGNVPPPGAITVGFRSEGDRGPNGKIKRGKKRIRRAKTAAEMDPVVSENNATQLDSATMNMGSDISDVEEVGPPGDTATDPSEAGTAERQEQDLDPPFTGPEIAKGHFPLKPKRSKAAEAAVEESILSYFKAALTDPLKDRPSK